jgi:hypothetical protein
MSLHHEEVHGIRIAICSDNKGNQKVKYTQGELQQALNIKTIGHSTNCTKRICTKIADIPSVVIK